MNISNYITQDNQSYDIMLYHELIHTVRFFSGIHDNTDSEEYATIYGLEGKSLYIEGKMITENTIRNEWGRLPRVSHDSRDIYVQGVRGQERNSFFTEESFINW
jgi:hypothetical protein